jgi:hydroxymethylpyrimidine/phosphomethylpyrimidine kinase
MPTPYHTILTIAGSDSSGGAGIQADIKSISANGGVGCSVITASTAQNTLGVTDIHPMPVAHIVKQLEAVLDDIHIDVVKIGMLHSKEVIEAVQKSLAHYDIEKIVLDPVMIATSGETLLSDDAIESLKAFLPKVTLITPNIPEAELLLGHSIDLENQEVSAKALAQMYHTSVLLKGGHLDFTDTMTDVLYNYESQKSSIIQNKAIESKNTHGTGCTLSSAIATYLAKGESLESAVTKGCTYLNKAIEAGKDKLFGHGHGSVNHFYKY